MRLELSAFVERDVDAIATYIAADNPQWAVTLIRAITDKFAAIARAPVLYRVRPEIGAEVRLASVGRYAILFRIREGDTMRIERVAYGGGELSELLDTDAP